MSEQKTLLAGLHAAKPASPHKLFIEGWCALYRERLGYTYMFQGAKDAAAVKRLLATGIPVESLLATARAAWVQTDKAKCWRCASHSRDIATFASGFNAIRAELAMLGAGPRYGGPGEPM